MRSMVDIHVSAAYSLTQPVKLGDEMICKYHPPHLQGSPP
ncbi:hypothetical protein SAMN03159290_01018 [Pseudomonas sp. NFACC13-1]|nr:hypothetical protein SAMN03159290_01018 [Pseudomonas sp. NFACC13-1]